MGIETNQNSIHDKNQEKIDRRLQKEEMKIEQLLQKEKKEAVEKGVIENDQLQKSNLHDVPLKQSEKMDHPLLYNHTSRFNRMSEALLNAQQKFDLPSSKDLLRQLSPCIQKKIQELLEESKFDLSEEIKIQKFFDTLSRLIPLGIALFHGLSSDEHILNLSNMRSSMIHTLQEIGDLMLKHQGTFSLTSQGQKLASLLSSQLRSLSSETSQTNTLYEQLRSILGSTILPNTEMMSYPSVQYLADEIDAALAGNKSTVLVAGHRKLITDLVDADLLSPSILSGSKVKKSILVEIKAKLMQFRSSDDDKKGVADTSIKVDSPMTPSIGFLASFLNKIRALPEEIQSEAIKIILSTQPIMTYRLTNRTLGPHTVHFAHSLSHLAVDYSRQLGLLSANIEQAVAAREYLTRIFTGLMITASFLSRLEVDRGDGKAMRLEDKEIRQAQKEAAKELQMHDLPPFSFFALWAPFRNLEDSKRGKHKQAAQALAEFMQVLMQLAYLLVAIFTGGKKLGENGVDILLEENQLQISSYLDSLIFSLKKLNEKFGVRTNQALERCTRSQIALRESDFPEFWTQIFLFCREKSDLKDFLEEVDLMDFFYDTIRTLVGGSGFDTSVVRM